MIAALEGRGHRYRDRLCVKRHVRGWDLLVGAPMIEAHNSAFRQMFPQRRQWLEFVRRPPALADEGRRQKKYPARLRGRWIQGKRIDEYRATDRVANKDRSVLERRDLIEDRALPLVERRTVLVGHARIPDFVSCAESR